MEEVTVCSQSVIDEVILQTTRKNKGKVVIGLIATFLQPKNLTISSSPTVVQLAKMLWNVVVLVLDYHKSVFTAYIKALK